MYESSSLTIMKCTPGKLAYSALSEVRVAYLIGWAWWKRRRRWRLIWYICRYQPSETSDTVFNIPFFCSGSHAFLTHSHISGQTTKTFAHFEIWIVYLIGGALELRNWLLFRWPVDIDKMTEREEFSLFSFGISASYILKIHAIANSTVRVPIAISTVIHYSHVFFACFSDRLATLSIPVWFAFGYNIGRTETDDVSDVIWYLESDVALYEVFCISCRVTPAKV